MRLDEFSNLLYSEMENELSESNDSLTYSIQNLKNASAIILQSIYRLKDFFIHYQINKEEEINFFKNIKPRFLSKLIYYKKAFEIKFRLPLGSMEIIRNFYLQEFSKLNEYLNNNKEFLIYYRSGSSAMDEIYFIRKEPDSWLLVNFEDYETDLSFTTIYDHKLSKIIAFEKLSDLIKESINKLEINSDKAINESLVNKQKVSWTGSKVSLIELLYALQSSGSFNNGTIDIKNLAVHFENVFNIELGNYYRVFQEIRIRKTSRTTFLDQLKERLVQRMDHADENPKFR